MSCRLFSVLYLALAIIISVSACPYPTPSYQPTADTIQIDAPQNIPAVEYNISIGHEVVIALSSNPSTGYSWQWMNKAEPALPSLTYLGCSYHSATSGGPPGGGGTEYWGFRASLVGTTSLPLSYRRPWETSADENNVTIKLHIMSNGTDVEQNGREKIYNNGYILLPSAILILSLCFSLVVA